MGPIGLAFEEANKAKRGLLFPEVVPGFPDPRASMKAIEYLAGMPNVVLKVPTPVATGHPANTNEVIVEAHRRALEAGWTPERVVQRLGLYRPNFLVIYPTAVTNGLDRFLESCSGYIDGCIVAEGPPCDEAGAPVPRLSADQAGDISKRYGTDVARIVYAGHEECFGDAVKAAHGLVYLALSGETGGTMVGPEGIARAVRAIRTVRQIPIMGGFGIGSAEQARQALSLGLDGLTVGTWLMEALSRGFLTFKKAADQLWEAMAK